VVCRASIFVAVVAVVSEQVTLGLKMAAAKGFDDALKTLLDMGFPEEKCKLALSNVDPPTTDGAVSGWFGCSKWLSGASWLCEHVA